MPLVPVPEEEGLAAGAIRFEPWRWPGRKHALLAEDGLHLIVTPPAGAGHGRHRLLLPGPDPPAEGTPLAVALGPSPFWPARVSAAARFFTYIGVNLPGMLAASRPEAVTAAPSPERLERLMHMLWALDLERAGLSEHEMGRLLFGTGVSGVAWSNHDDRSELRRLLAAAHALLDGGYFRLLGPHPWRR